MKYRFDTIGSDFRCKHCHAYVSTDPNVSGVNNRNHCPYCLHSRHMDMLEAGDRLSACKAEMRPVGLALKKTSKKYGKQQGELMIIHQCSECESISVNRTAADDDADTILEIFHRSLQLDPQSKTRIQQSGIQFLTSGDYPVVCARLFGWGRCPERSPSFA